MRSNWRATDAEGCLSNPAFPARDLRGSGTILFGEHPKNTVFAPKSAGFAGFTGTFLINVRKENKALPILQRLVSTTPLIPHFPHPLLGCDETPNNRKHMKQNEHTQAVPLMVTVRNREPYVARCQGKDVWAGSMVERMTFGAKVKEVAK